jgi:hypothetical protein
VQRPANQGHERRYAQALERGPRQAHGWAVRTGPL